MREGRLLADWIRYNTRKQVQFSEPRPRPQVQEWGLILSTYLNAQYPIILPSGVLEATFLVYTMSRLESSQTMGPSWLG